MRRFLNSKNSDGGKMANKFKERYLAGEIEFDEIDRMIEEWGNSKEECTLREYLGLDSREEDIWIEESDEALKELLDLQKESE